MTTTELVTQVQQIFNEIAPTVGLKKCPTPEEWKDLWADPLGKGWIIAMVAVHNNAIKSVTEETTNLIVE